MKRTDVIIAGLVVVGVFGLVFACQTFSQAEFTSHSGVAVGSCVWIRFKTIDECYVAEIPCEIKNSQGTIVDCNSQWRPKCSTPAYIEDSSSAEVGGVEGSLSNWQCPGATVYSLPCHKEEWIYYGSGGPVEWIVCTVKGGVATPFSCPSGTYKSHTSC
ncbi:MAG: hypothetical protein FWE95_00225 [Planctomycetaceae bacterium]|nr:hypothetical protein [Planctomycetaceae bacterium]